MPTLIYAIQLPIGQCWTPRTVTLTGIFAQSQRAGMVISRARQCRLIAWPNHDQDLFCKEEEKTFFLTEIRFCFKKRIVIFAIFKWMDKTISFANDDGNTKRHFGLEIFIIKFLSVIIIIILIIIKRTAYI